MKKIILIAATICMSSAGVFAQAKKGGTKKVTTKKVEAKPQMTTIKKVTVGKPAASTSKWPKVAAGSNPFANVTTTSILPGNIAIKQVVKGTGKIKGDVGNNIKLHIRAYVSDSMLFDSYKLNNNQPVPAAVSAPQFKGDIMELFPMMVAGDSLVAYVLQDSIFRGGMKPPFAKEGDLVVYELNLIDVKSKEEAEREQKEAMMKSVKIDEDKILAYIKEKGLKDVKRTESGLYYQITEPGEGASPAAGTQVTMNYTGYLLDGSVFDSNVDPKFNHVAPFDFKLGVGQVIKGWDEGVALLKKGAKGKLIIPSAMAYGPSERPGLPANSVLVFDVELVKF